MKEALLAWYAATAATCRGAHTNDPYAILVSEVMLQQTQVDRVIPRWERWLERWPTVEALAAASTAEVIVEWQGLGYNRRAVSLHRAAQAVARSGWPDDLTDLPGVGPYTAAAVGNFAFGRDVLPVDTNVRRVQERTGEAFDGGMRAGAVRSRRHDLPRAHPALRRMPARGRVPLAREAATSRCGGSRGSRARSASVARVALRAVAAGADGSDDDEALASLARDGLVTLAGDGTAALPV